MSALIRAQWYRLASEANAYDADRYNEVISHGGFSKNPHSGKSPTSGYAVSVHPSHGGVEHVIPLSEFTPEHIKAHREAADHLLRHPDYHQGAWVDGDKVYLDVSRVHENQQTAENEGKKHKQLAIYDIAGDKSIRLDHDGS